MEWYLNAQYKTGSSAPGVRNLQPAGHTRPARVVYAALEDLQLEN